MSFNEINLKDSLTKYEDAFPARWETEKYKWEAIEKFKKHWDPDAANFADMLENSLSGTGNLLASNKRFPRDRIVEFAKSPEGSVKVRAMFKDLFDESSDVVSRIQKFKAESDKLLQNMLQNSTNKNFNHHQDENSISTYLWLRFPDQYYIYKFTEAHDLATILGCNDDYQFIRGKFKDNLTNFYAFYRKLNEEICKDETLTSLFDECRKKSGSSYYSDKKRITLTMDFGYYIAYVLRKKPPVAFPGDDDVKHYWLYSPGDNASNWNEFYNAGIMAIGWDKIGDLRAFTSKSEMQAKMQEAFGSDSSYKNSALATWQFAKVMKPGDIVFAKKGQKGIVGCGIIESDYEYDTTREKYKNIRKVNWTHDGSWVYPGKAVVKVLTDITDSTGIIKSLNEALGEGDVIIDDEPQVSYEPYTAAEFLEDVYMTPEDYDTLVDLLEDKKNIILQGPPGVGKTYAAKRLAYSILEEKDQNRVMMVQFHQSYSYEDFIIGLLPVKKDEYDFRYGPFYQFCKKAEEDNVDGDEETKYFFIIDEINRGNLSKIFGELFMLIENDKRGISLPLLYSDETFSVPKNVYIIGMMNTADRSLALLDYALRRRFSFYEMKPGFETEQFKKYQEGLNSEKFNKLIACVMDLNAAIKNDESLGEGFSIGHSYFCNLKSIEIDKKLSRIIKHEIIPLLKEYWFDEPDKLETWSKKLENSIK